MLPYQVEANHLTDLLYDPSLPPEQVAAACREWGRRYPTAAAPPHRPPLPRGRLRVGYFSANFRANPEVFFTLPILRHHDRRRFDIYCYFNGPSADAFTREFRSLAVTWRNVARLTDDAAAARIRRDGIDLLVDLGGHWAHGRVPMFARRPAPVQISFPTYPCSTGLPAMDFRITDTDADPPGPASDALHTERLVRLPGCYCCYEPPKRLPRPGSLPATAANGGAVTFGSFHRPQKLSGELLRMWSRILLDTPGSRILFHHVFGGGRDVDAPHREAILAALGSHGIAPERVLFAGLRTLHEHLATLAQADIALDAFPYHGMTITCESLAMGVPVVTLAGRSHSSRAGVSILKAAGLSGWIAATPQEYIGIATRWAAQPPLLAQLRAALPAQVRRSPLTDARRYTRGLEAAYLACCGRAGSPVMAGPVRAAV